VISQKKNSCTAASVQFTAAGYSSRRQREQCQSQEKLGVTLCTLHTPVNPHAQTNPTTHSITCGGSFCKKTRAHLDDVATAHLLEQQHKQQHKQSLSQSRRLCPHPFSTKTQRLCTCITSRAIWLAGVSTAVPHPNSNPDTYPNSNPNTLPKQQPKHLTQTATQTPHPNSNPNSRPSSALAHAMQAVRLLPTGNQVVT
jgi:hypothetical protein